MSSSGVRRVLSVAMAPAAASLSAARGLGAVAASFPISTPQQKKQSHSAAPVASAGACRIRHVRSLATKASRPAGSVQSVSGAGTSLKTLLGGVSSGVRVRRNGPGGVGVRCEATVAEREEAPPAAQKFEYQAEVNRLLKLIVHSLYSHKEVFLRELVSNASDALDKLRFLSVTDPSMLGDHPNMEIRIMSDRDAGTITIIDTGIGMTQEELVDSLGTIAQSGTARFLNAMKEQKEGNAGDNNLIGQFGVGFYSAFLVADRVTVRTKSVKSDKQYVWEGEADSSSYSIREEDDEIKRLARGTAITLHLKEDDKFEYADPTRIQNLVKNYSQFISFPIYVWQEKTRQVEVEEEAPAGEETAAPEATAEGSEKKDEKKTKTERYYEWELANETKPIWMRGPKEVPKEEYDTFFKNTFKDFADPLAYTHFTTEGEIEFKSLLYIPGMAPFGDDAYNPKTKNIRLYVKRVFISDEFDGELFPRYLGFVKGVVDSNDLPLNVSREILQESRIVRIMKKRLVRKTFDMIEDIAARENEEDYKTFWTNFGKNIKLGAIEDQTNHKRICPLLRFFSSKSEEELVSLDTYIGRMKEEQKAIYYLAADTVKSAKSAPFLEALQKKDFEVLFLVEPIDEVAISNLQSYKDKKFVDISKEDLDLGDDENKAEVEKEYRLLTDWMKQILGEKVAKVQTSTRLSSVPCVLVSGKFGWSANMERIMKAQTLGDTSTMEFMKGRRVLEVNPDHPIIKDLNLACKNTPNNDKVRNLVDLLYETSLLSSGFQPENPAEFGGKIFEIMAMAIGKQSDEIVEEYVEDLAPTAGESSVEAAEVVEPTEVRTENDPWKS